MRTTKLFTSVIAALSLMYSSGCCDSDCYYPQPAGVDCPPVAYASGVTYEPGCPPPVAVGYAPVIDCPPVVECPPPKPVKVKKPKKAKYGRKRVRCYVPASPCDPCNVQYYPTVAYAGTATLLSNPEYVPAVTVAPAPRKSRKSEVAGDCVTVLQRGHKGRKVMDKPSAKQPRRTREATRPVAYSAPTIGPVYTVEPAPAVVSEPYSITPLSPPPAEPAKPVVKEEPKQVEAVVEAVIEAAPEPIVAVVEVIPEPVIEKPAYAKYIDPTPPAAALLAPPIEVVVVEAAPAVPLELVPGMVLESPYPAAVQPMHQQVIQPVVIQPIIQPMMNPGAVQMPPAQIYGQMPQSAPVPPGPNSWVQGGLVSSAYCPPEICPTPNTSLCAPGMNLSECFTLSENQLLNSQQIYTPDALNPLMPLSPMPAPVVPLAQVQTPPPAAPAMQSKYAALTPPPDITRDARRPEVSMPTPLGGDNMPVVPSTAEIEHMLDAMVPPPNLK